MTSIRCAMSTSAVSLAAVLCLTATLHAQTQTPAPPTVRPPEAPLVQGPLLSYGSSALRIGQDYALRAGATAEDVTIVLGNAVIDGRVENDLVVVLGKAQISSTAYIGGELLVVGGSASIAAGAQVSNGLLVVGGTLDAPPDFRPGGDYVVVGSTAIGTRLEALLPWVTRGFLWGRPIVPGLAWVWGVVAIFFLVYLALNVAFRRPVRLCANTIAERPLTAFLTGLLVLLLSGPVMFLLTISVIGIVVVPLVLCAVLAAGLLGKIGVFRRIGMGVVHEVVPDSPLQAIRSFAIGFAVIAVAYMVPLLGFATLALVSVLGLGGATLAFLAGYRRENPIPPPRPRPEPPPAPMPIPTPTWTPPVEASPLAAPSPSAATASLEGAVPSSLLSFPHAAFLERLGAFVLDVFLVFLVRQLLWAPRGGPGPDSLFLLLLAYHIAFWTWKGTTVGGIICQLRLVRIDGVALRFVDALVRGLSSIFSLAVFGIGCLWILRDPDRQAWHDRIAGTYVVKVPRNWPI